MKELDRYLDRIGYDGQRAPTVDVLRRLHLLHTRSIPFENLSPLFGIEVKLDVPSVLDKFTRERRGGYCFEHNLLFRSMLHALGFRTTGLAARVRWNVSGNEATPRSHMLMLVDISGERWIADTGFGGMTLTAPLRLDPGRVQETPHEAFRLMQSGPDYFLQAQLGTEWKTVYVFDLSPQQLADYEVSSWYVSHHPQSHFVTDLIATRPVPNGRHALHNNRYSFYGLDGTQEKKEIETVDALKDVLERLFGIRIPDHPDAEKKLREALRA